MNKLWLWSLVLIAFSSLADGLVVDKVYQPYVLLNEKSVEWRLISAQTDTNNRLGQRLGYGQAISEHTVLEGYLIAERDDVTHKFDIQSYEFEIRTMLTEQGQYWADWGLLFEIENEDALDRWEIGAGILFEKEFTNTSLTLNSFLIYESGHNIKDEFEIEFRAKYRYRYHPAFQPAIEIYTGEQFFGIGPALMGVYRIDGKEQLKWEAGFIAEISQSGKDHSLRMSIEYEF